jgi:hypothetical protein
MPDAASLPCVKRPQLQGHQVLYDDVQHVVILDGAIIVFTPVEYSLLLHLLNMPQQQLLSASMRRSLKQRMSQLRPRLWPFGLDILCLHDYGYLLLSRSDEQAEEK